MTRIVNAKKLREQISSNYGTFRGFIRASMYKLLFNLGMYKSLNNIEWSKVERLVFICKGNICRSAFAEAVARSLNIDSISCGIDTHNGKPANEVAIRTAATKGFCLLEHKTSRIDSISLKSGDLLIAMEPNQQKYIRDFVGNKYPSSLMGLWGVPVMPFIPDPYASTDAYFENCFNYIEKSVSKAVKEMNNSQG